MTVYVRWRVSCCILVSVTIWVSITCWATMTVLVVMVGPQASATGPQLDGADTAVAQPPPHAGAVSQLGDPQLPADATGDMAENEREVRAVNATATRDFFNEQLMGKETNRMGRRRANPGGNTGGYRDTTFVSAVCWQSMSNDAIWVVWAIEECKFIDPSRRGGKPWG